MPYNIVLIDPTSPSKEIIANAVSLLQKGEVIAFPTDTVYGVGGDIFSDEAIEKLYRIKNRSKDKPINALISSLEQLDTVVESIPDLAQDILKKFWPGPLTVILKKKATVSSKVTSNLETIGVRMPNNKIALELINEFGKPLATTSANISEKQSSLTAKEVYDSFQENIPMILDSQEQALGIESTIISFVSAKPKILRRGYITKEELSEYVVC